MGSLQRGEGCSGETFGLNSLSELLAQRSKRVVVVCRLLRWRVLARISVNVVASTS